MNPANNIFNPCKKWLKNKLHQSPSTVPEYLHSLGVRLLWHFPMEQVFDILTDYQEYLTAGNNQGTETDRLFQRFGSPDTVTRTLLTENQPRNPYLYLKPLLWGILLFPALWETLYQDRLAPVFLCLTCFALFGLIHGWEYRRLGHRFPSGHLSMGRIVLVHLLILAVIIAKERGMWYICIHAAALPAKIYSIHIGTFISSFLYFAELLFLLATGIMLVNSVFSSIRYFPAAIHAMGASVATVKTLQLLKSTDLSAQIPKEILFSPLLCYAAALILSLCFTAFLRPHSPAGGHTKRGG